MRNRKNITANIYVVSKNKLHGGLVMYRGGSRGILRIQVGKGGGANPEMQLPLCHQIGS